LNSDTVTPLTKTVENSPTKERAERLVPSLQ